MRISQEDKGALKRTLVRCLSGENEITKIIVLGSFLTSETPHDIDVAVFQDSAEGYLPLALRYRKRTRDVSRIIPLDLIPVNSRAWSGPFLDEITKGEVIYER
ncbi:MAG: nucleotidyltransferase domain-containing protein [Candidatus Eisenbacteria bacterium]|jgi:predicted nucleotidyltransferase|nr:nucleotidyltransferase domain-containing protein [Candidatus Eisenbacteria bacterium]